MSDFQIKDGTFTLHRQEKKKENSPDYSGKGMFEGQEVAIFGWAKMKKDGSGVYISGYIKRPQDREDSATKEQADAFLVTPAIEAAQTSARPEPASDDLPF